jgi:hypothetical protein
MHGGKPIGPEKFGNFLGLGVNRRSQRFATGKNG